MTAPAIAQSTARPPTTPPTIAPVLVFLFDWVVAGAVGPVTIVRVTITPLTVTTCTLVTAELGGSLLGAAEVRRVVEAADELLELELTIEPVG